jgi:hypothetical protein
VTLLEYKGGFYIALPTDSPSVSTYKAPHTRTTHTTTTLARQTHTVVGCWSCQ